MPILDPEPDLWPVDAFDAAPDAESRWGVLYSRSRSEKALARQLKGRGIGYFLPVHRTSRRYQRRTVTASIPLFPGYVFVLANDEQLPACRMLKECVGELPVGDQDLLRRNLIDLQRLLASGLPVTREERLRPGMLARITRGSLADMVGTVVRNRRGTKFVLEVQFINQGVSVEIEGDAVEAV